MTTQNAIPSRSRGGIAMLIVCAVIALFLLGDAVVRAGLGQTLLLAPWVLLALWVIYVAAVASQVSVRPEGLLVQNLLRRTYAPWSRVRNAEMRWQVEVTLDDGSTVTCFGGPARRRPQRLGPDRAKEDVNGAANDLVATIRRAKSQAGHSAEPISRGWDVTALLVLLGLIVWAVAAVWIAYR